MKAQQCGSLPILIGRGLDLRRERETRKALRSTFPVQFSRRERSGEKSTPKMERKSNREPKESKRAKASAKRTPTANLESRIEFPVTIARGKHLYPSRTQKLRLSAPMVLGWKRPGRVGRRRIPLERCSNEHRSSFIYQIVWISECKKMRLL